MTSNGSTILVVDDEIGIRRILKVCLASAGFVVYESASGHEALSVISELQPDLVLLDLGLPDMDGSKVITRVRQSNQCPILILSIRDQESDKVTALDAGADDYLIKPFGNRELLARIRALLRRGRSETLTTNFKCGAFTIDEAHHAAQIAGKPVRLTRTEYTLLKSLVHRQGNVATHRQLVREVWSGMYNENALHVLHVTMSNLRRKTERDPLRPQFILTEPGVGYRIATETERLP
jgi:two-component system, OmpR family, KDP operon response regulator KdpE